MLIIMQLVRDSITVGFADESLQMRSCCDYDKNVVIVSNEGTCHVHDVKRGCEL